MCQMCQIVHVSDGYGCGDSLMCQMDGCGDSSMCQIDGCGDSSMCQMEGRGDSSCVRWLAVEIVHVSDGRMWR